MASAKLSNPTKRQVRKEAGYGCCKCGCEIIEYHHIVPSSDKPEDIMALCPACHDMATKGAMPINEQLRYKNNPHNIIQGYSKGKLTINPGKIPPMFYGHNTIEPFGDMIVVDGETLFGLNVNEEWVVELSLKLYDENDNLLFEIRNNEWISGDYLAWDIEVSYEWIKIRLKKGKIVLDVNTHGAIKIRADIWRKGSNIKIKPGLIEVISPKGELQFSTNQICGVYFQNIGFRVDANGNFFLG